MRAVVQRVHWARVEVNSVIVGECGPGLLVFAAAHRDDTDANAAKLADRIAGVRIFNDREGRINRSLKDIGGSILAISNFTIYGDASRNRRPSFGLAAPFEQGKALFESFITELRKLEVTVQTGVFGADMQVSLLNDGPVTIVIDG